ncbi:MAG: 2-amino-4-hydroxy-6-hydroxymethyldihydropteridine diphosphokinase [Microthrixaceae bacterium]|nr:2-amino-4-hydroxy-6-hydroxymethyldihydropteridine diphosphokinase [Microthrixaceae bacterium]
MTRSFIGVGSNLGDRRQYLRDAVDSLPDKVAVSGVYETDPVGGPGRQGPYLNIVVELETELSPSALLSVCHRIESAAHRVRDERWGPRTLDLDIIWMDGVSMDEPRLTIPHPRWKERKFVLAPLRELAPDLVTAQEVELAEGRVWTVENLS